jgi:hypothetical protein
MDSAEVERARHKKEMLDKKDDAEKLTFVCEQLYGGD